MAPLSKRQIPVSRARPPSLAEGDAQPRLTRVPLSRPGATQPLAAFTVDVEDWYQSCFDYDAPISERVVRNTERVLSILDECRVKGTFFVQGRVAETFPKLLESLVAEGHEVQCHGYSHRPLFSLDRRGLRDELERSRKTVEDACGMAVDAFRAQDFSVLRRNLWALDLIAEVGFTLDSSIFPMRMRRYGISGWELAPHNLTLSNGAVLLEVPVAVWEIKRMRLPLAGGGYFRFLPQRLLEHGLQAIAASGRPVVIYCHPYEFNPDELAEFRTEISSRRRFTQGFRRRSSRQRVKGLLETLPFGRLDQVLSAWRVR